jgi:TRAP-type C4-dicarboxylate transport system permease small subunit
MLALDAIVVVFLCLLIFYGYRMVLLTSSNVTPALGASVGYAMYLSLPVGAALMILNIVLRWLSPTGGEETEGHLDL